MATNFQEWNCRKTINCNQEVVRAVRFTVDGSYILSCGADKSLKLWNPTSGLLIKTYGGHEDEVTDATGSHDNNHILSASLDKSIIYWDVSRSTPVYSMRNHLGGVNCVRYLGNTSIAISGARDNTVMLWDIRTRQMSPFDVMDDATDWITSVLSNDNQIITSSLDGGIRYYDIRKGGLMCAMLNVPVMHITQTKKQKYVVAACNDGAVYLINCPFDGLISLYEGRRVDDHYIECALILRDSCVISGTSEGCAMIWDMLYETLLQRIEISKNGGVVSSIATHPNIDEILLSRSGDVHVLLPGSKDVEQSD